MIYSGIVLMCISGLGWVISLLIRYNDYRTKVMHKSPQKSVTSTKDPVPIIEETKIRHTAEIGNDSRDQVPKSASLYTAGPIENWSRVDVHQWLMKNECEGLIPAFRSNSIDGLALSTRTVELLKIGAVGYLG